MAAAKKAEQRLMEDPRWASLSYQDLEVAATRAIAYVRNSQMLTDNEKITILGRIEEAAIEAVVHNITVTWADEA